MKMLVALVVGLIIGGLVGFHVGRVVERCSRIAALTYVGTSSDPFIPQVPVFALAMAERDTEAFVVQRYPNVSVDICMAIGPYSVLTSGQTDEDFSRAIGRYFEKRLLVHMEQAASLGRASNQFLHGLSGVYAEDP